MNNNHLKKILILFLIIFFVLINCNSPSNSIIPKTSIDTLVAGVWEYSLIYNNDTTIYIVMNYHNTYNYLLNVNLNHKDTMHVETGIWNIISDTINKVDSVLMMREKCRQINFQTQTLDSIDCGISLAGIKIDISLDAGKYKWIIPLSDFIKYLPQGFIPPGTHLPVAVFYKQ